MRVLILANGRTGSTSLMLGLASGLRCEYIAEPWNLDLIDKIEPKHHEIDYHNLPEDVVVKCIVNVKQYLGFYMYWTKCPFDCSGLDWLDNGSEAVFWYRFAQKFDKIILLDRYDVRARVLSALHAQHYEEWHGEYEFKEEIIPPHKNMKELYIKEEVSSELLKLLSRKLEVDITYYEEIFNNKQRESYFGLPIDSEKLFENFLNTKHRYQQ
jgi:hypothetical protein